MQEQGRKHFNQLQKAAGRSLSTLRLNAAPFQLPRKRLAHCSLLGKIAEISKARRNFNYLNSLPAFQQLK